MISTEKKLNSVAQLISAAKQQTLRLGSKFRGLRKTVASSKEHDECGLPVANAPEKALLIASTDRGLVSTRHEYLLANRSASRRLLALTNRNTRGDMQLD